MENINTEIFSEKSTENIEVIQRMLGNIGLVWANVNESVTTEHPEDNVWLGYD